METCGKVEVQLLAFLTSALNEVELSLSRPDRFTAEERVPDLDAADKRNLFTLTGFYCFFFFSFFLEWGETESTWYVGHYWPIVPALDDT
jgi:hypothetical protein